MTSCFQPESFAHLDQWSKQHHTQVYTMSSDILPKLPTQVLPSPHSVCVCVCVCVCVMSFGSRYSIFHDNLGEYTNHSPPPFHDPLEKCTIHPLSPLRDHKEESMTCFPPPLHDPLEKCTIHPPPPLRDHKEESTTCPPLPLYDQLQESMIRPLPPLDVGSLLHPDKICILSCAM